MATIDDWHKAQKAASLKVGQARAAIERAIEVADDVGDTFLGDLAGPDYDQWLKRASRLEEARNALTDIAKTIREVR